MKFENHHKLKKINKKIQFVTINYIQKVYI